MKSTNMIAAICFLSLSYISGCASLEVGRQVQAGRNALQTGRPNEAAAYLMRAAETDPGYNTPFRLPQSVLTYLGRAYYETGRDEEAKRVLELALNKNQDDHVARLYLGLTRLRNAEPARGRHEVEASIREIHATLDYLAADNVNGIFWDPARTLRNKIEHALRTDGDLPLLISSAEQIGRDFDEEMDTARRDEGRHRNGRGGGGGD
jgi:tetratricopeptide (TPR) repeat protein